MLHCSPPSADAFSGVMGNERGGTPPACLYAEDHSTELMRDTIERTVTRADMCAMRCEIILPERDGDTARLELDSVEQVIVFSVHPDGSRYEI